MSLTILESIRVLQRKLYPKAQAELGFRFYQLCDKIWRAGMLAHGLLRRGCTDMVDADLSKDVDTFPHAQPMQSVTRRIVDRQVRDRDGTERMNGGKDTDPRHAAGRGDQLPACQSLHEPLPEALAGQRKGRDVPDPHRHPQARRRG